MKRPLTDKAVKEIKDPKWGKAYPDSPYFSLPYFRTYYVSQTTILVFAQKNIMPSARSHKKTSFKPESTSESRCAISSSIQTTTCKALLILRRRLFAHGIWKRRQWHVIFLPEPSSTTQHFGRIPVRQKGYGKLLYLLPEKIRRPPAVCRGRDFFMHQSTSPIEQSSVCYNKCMSLCTYALTLFFNFLQNKANKLIDADIHSCHHKYTNRSMAKE